MVGRQKDGAHFPIEVSLSSYQTDNGYWIVVTIRDITQRKEMEKIEQKQKRELELYSSLLRHDLRNDLGVILGNMDLLELSTDSNDSEEVDTIASTQAVAERMDNLLAILSYEPEHIETNPAKLVEGVSSQAEVINSNIAISVQIDEDADTLTIPPCRMLPMVFENVYRNIAIHAGERPHVETTVRRSNGSVEIIIQDDGPGIAQEVRCCLFQKGASTNGGGMGLYLSREIVTAIGGSIELIESKESEGAAFKILLPLENCDYDPVPSVEGGM
jgi:signal transduction histidine kinase